MRRLALALFLLASCARREQAPQTVPARCNGLCGRVIDAQTKKPIANFDVVMFDAEPRSGAPQIRLPDGYPRMPGPMLEQKHVESSDGSFTMRLPQGRVYVGASADGYKLAQTGAVDASLPITIELTRANRIRGRVINASGAPIAGARVESSATDAKGHFEIDGPRAAWMQIDVEADGYMPMQQIVHETDDDIDITMVDAARLSGIVRDTSGAPFSGAGIYARCGEFASHTTNSHRDGSFTLQVEKTNCTVIAGPGLRNDDEHREVVASEPRVEQTVDLTNGDRRVELTIEAPRRSPSQSPPR